MGVNEKENDATLQEALQQTEELQKKKDKRKKLLLILLLFLIVAGVAFWITSRPKSDRLSREAAAIEGLIPGKSDQEIQDILSKVVEEGMVNVSINQTPIFEGRKGEVGIQNIPGNHYSFTVTITLDDTGEEIYKSNLIDPGYYVNEISLKKRLDVGVYKATAVFHVYDVQEDADTEIASVSSAMTLSVFS